MNMRVISAEDKLKAVQIALTILRTASTRHSQEVVGLKEIAKDLQARAELPRNRALSQIEHAMKSLEGTKTALGYDMTALRRVADVVIANWPLIQQALERYGEESAE